MFLVYYSFNAHTRLEDKIISIIAKLEVVAEEIKEKHIAEDECKIRRAEEERIRKKNEEKERAEPKIFENKQRIQLSGFREMLKWQNNFVRRMFYDNTLLNMKHF